MLFKNKKGELIEAKNNYEANILMSNKDYTPFENEEKSQSIVINEEKIEENHNETEKVVKKSSKKKDGE